jgi:hypothetical protein
MPLLAAGVLAACGGDDAANEAVNLGNFAVPPGNAVSNASVDSPAAPPAAAPAAKGVTAAQPAPPSPTPPASTAPAEAPAAKRPAAPPPQPRHEPDPHAGHDMSNMANMQH